MPRRQYENDVRRAVEESSGRAYAGTRAAASKRIVNDSMLSRQQVQRTNGASRLLDRMGVPQRFSKNSDGTYRRVTPVVFRRSGTRTVERHDASRRDPETGFGMNVQRRQKVFRISYS